MKTSHNQTGSSHLVLLLLVAVFAVVGFAGYRVMKNQDSNTAVSNEPAAVAAAPVVPSKIQSKSQAQQASKALDAESIDKNLDSSQLDNDLKSVL